MTSADPTTLDARPPEEVAEVIGDVRDRLVVLDFDGTLSPIVDDPDAAQLAPGAAAAVGDLARLTRVAVLSGRHLDDLSPRVGDLDVTLAGGHGSELREVDGTRTPLLDHDAVRGTLDRLEGALRELVDPDDGWVVEPKPASLAIHHRMVPEDVRERLLPEVHALMEDAADEPPGWDVLDGKAVTELRPTGTDKGTALDVLVERLGGTPLVVGDDVTDEDAFRAAVRHGGDAVLVAEEPRETVARWRITDPHAVVTLLRELAARSSGG